MDTPTETYRYAHYHADLRAALSKLINAKTLQEQYQKLLVIQRLDERFIKKLAKPGADIKRVYFTRHGQCDTFTDKYAGLAPNASVNPDALRAMQSSHIVTRAFLQKNESTSTIVISPMLRAQQTAAELIPDQFAGKIDIQTCITENSCHPSGQPIVNSTDLLAHEDLWHQTSGMFFKEDYFKNLQALQQQSIAQITNKSAAKSIHYAENVDILDDEKVEKIHAYISANPGDVWLIGHGKNFGNYFEKRYLLQQSPDYCETWIVFHFLDKDNIPTEFVIPYSLKINQKTGFMEADLRISDLSPGYRSTLEKELQSYSIGRMEEHHFSQNMPLYENPFRFFTQTAKEIWGIDCDTKVSAVIKLGMLLRGEKPKEPLSSTEINALMHDRVGGILEKYAFNLLEFLANLEQQKPQELQTMCA